MRHGPAGVASRSAVAHAWSAVRRNLGRRRRRRQLLAVALAVSVVALDVAAYSGLIGFVHVGSQPVSPSLIPALGLTLVLGTSLAGRDRGHDAALTYWVCSLVVFLVVVVAYQRTAHLSQVAGIVAVSVDEELVYRLALPAMLATIAIRLSVRPDWARVVGFTLAGVAWMLLPGHRAQMTDVANVLSLAAFAVIMAVICLRSGSIYSAALAHVCSNLLTIAVWQDAIPRTDRSVLMAALLALLYLGYGRRVPLKDDHPQLGGPRLATATPEVIDLRASAVDDYARELSGPTEDQRKFSQ